MLNKTLINVSTTLVVVFLFVHVLIAQESIEQKRSKSQPADLLTEIKTEIKDNRDLESKKDKIALSVDSLPQLQVKITNLPENSTWDKLIPVLITFISVIVGTIIGWFLNDKSRRKELERKILSENRIKWIEIFRQEIAELLYNLDKLGMYALGKSALEKKRKIPGNINSDTVLTNYTDTLENVSLLINKVKLLLHLGHETHEAVLSAILDLRNTQMNLDCEINNQKELDERYNNLLHQCHEIIQFERYIVEDEVRGKM